VNCSRRTFLASLAAAVPKAAPAAETIIDIHQHTNYSDRSDDVLVKHQEIMGITKSILLPAGAEYGLEAKAFGNDSVVALAKRYPDRFAFFANEVPYFPQAREVLEKYLKAGAVGIGEQKFFIDVNSPPMYLICDIAQHYNVPILLHFQHERYNVNFDQFWKVLAKYPKVNFIGHAQTWWANIDKAQAQSQEILYPRWKVTAGGYTDRYLSDYPNMFGDLSAGSGFNAFARDEVHAVEFLKRHQDKLLYGSDCNDHVGKGEKCSGSQQIAAIRRLAPGAIQQKIFHGNARRIIRL
jgi:predicted TIM-barrel fold metal-dependent hydrolase